MSKNDNRPVAIKVSGVKKMYKLGQIGGGTLQKDLQSWWARKRGREDPNSKIGEGERSSGDTFMALNGIDLTIYQGEAVGIIGSNGAGKSTLLKILSRVTAPTEGDIDIYGRIASMLEVGTGFNGELTGRENVYMNGAILGMKKAEIDAKMEEIIDFSEVREFIDTPVKRYSSGMFVKLAFSVAAHLDAEIMIMDEVLAVGDVSFQTKCLNKMKEAAQQDGRTVLYVSHNMSTIRKLCDKCIVLEKGQVVFQGGVEESISRYIGNIDSNYNDELSLDLSNVPRDGKFNYRAKILSLEIIEATSNCFTRGDKMHIALVCDVNENIDCLFFRFEMYHTNGTIIGTTFSNKGIEVKKGQRVKVFMEIDTTNIAEGGYYAIALPYEVDSSGNQQHTDRVEPAFTFRITRDENTDLLNWNHSWWGSVILNKTKIEKHYMI